MAFRIVKCFTCSMAWVVLMAGCASYEPDLVKTMDVAEMKIRWERGIEAKCGGARNPPGCAHSMPGICVITMPENSRAAVVAEEFLHCFGYSHKQ